MREILFRGKRIDNDEWVYGSFCMDALEQFNGLCGVDGFIRLYDKTKCKMQTHEHQFSPQGCSNISRTFGTMRINILEIEEDKHGTETD